MCYMIGALKGKFVGLDGNVGLIETSGGVLYQSYLTTSFITHHPLGSPVYLLTYLQVKDDGLVLFGFENNDEQKLFKLLITVSGVGPKTAFNVISNSVSKELLEAITRNDVSYFTRIPGLGKKTAMKIILELAQKMKSEVHLENFNMDDDDNTVIQALVALGYPSNDAHRLFTQIPPELSVEEKIKYALQLTTKQNEKNKAK